MPELPEVETTRRGLLPYVIGQRIVSLIVREPRLRWPIPSNLARHIAGHTVESLERRAKYLLLTTSGGTLLLHLGMSGSLRVIPADTPPSRYEPFDLVFASGFAIRLRDPRRFGALLFSTDPQNHPLLRDLGPEPLEEGWDGAYLHQRARGRTIALRDFLLNGHIIAGVGNIYANETLFHAKLRPSRTAGRVSRAAYNRLAGHLVEVLTNAIAAGGTTLKDFSDSTGRPGYFQQELMVYGRENSPCHHCQTPITRRILSGRSTFYCRLCQH